MESKVPAIAHRRKFKVGSVRRGSLVIPEATLFIDQKGTKHAAACIEVRFKAGEGSELFRLYACLGRQLDNAGHFGLTPRNVSYCTLVSRNGIEPKYVSRSLEYSSNESIKKISPDDLRGEWLMQAVSPLVIYDIKLLGHRTLAWVFTTLREYNPEAVDLCPVPNFLEFETPVVDAERLLFEIPTDSIVLQPGESMNELKKWVTMVSSDISDLRIPPIPAPRPQWDQVVEQSGSSEAIPQSVQQADTEAEAAPMERDPDSEPEVGLGGQSQGAVNNGIRPTPAPGSEAEPEGGSSHNLSGEPNVALSREAGLESGQESGVNSDSSSSGEFEAGADVALSREVGPEDEPQIEAHRETIQETVDHAATGSGETKEPVSLSHTMGNPPIPVELLRPIFGFVAGDSEELRGRLARCSNLLRVNSTFHREAQHTIYNNIVIKDSKRELEKDIITLRYRWTPEKARRVESFTFVGGYWDYRINRPVHDNVIGSRYKADLIHNVRAVVSTCKRIRKLSVTAPLALDVVTNGVPSCLRILCLESLAGRTRTNIGPVLKEGKSLLEIRLSALQGDCTLYSTPTPPTLGSSLKTLVLHQLRIEGFQSASQSLTSLENLTIDSCVVDAMEMTRVLRGLKSLEYLRFEESPKTDHADESNHYCDALALSPTNLKYLEIRLKEVCECLYDAPWPELILFWCLSVRGVKSQVAVFQLPGEPTLAKPMDPFRHCKFKEEISDEYAAMDIGVLFQSLPKLNGMMSRFGSREYL
ncbi:hypothetical protein TWF481_010960 [Arthrobotrys musiformis]|uniref:F-box domain-containing protein n=1 Tax=Arthrobotrys musiformis TaxID=47236 RepID=A0AAV9VWW7_9PEZI